MFYSRKRNVYAYIHTYINTYNKNVKTKLEAYSLNLHMQINLLLDHQSFFKHQNRVDSKHLPNPTSFICIFVFFEASSSYGEPKYTQGENI